MNAKTTNARWVALGALSLTQLIVSLGVTIVNSALPKVQATLGFSNGDRQWLVTAYALAFGSLLLLGGRLSDYWGHRRTLIVGLTGFAAASVGCGVATNYVTLVSARAAQGIFGALVAPAALAALAMTFREPRARAQAFSFYGAIGGSGVAVGLVVGGVLTQWLTWRWCLGMSAIVAMMALFGVIVSVPLDEGDHGVRIDGIGALLTSVSLFGLVFGFAHAVSNGWTNVGTWGSLVGSGVVGLIFWRWRADTAVPLVPHRMLRHRTRTGSLVALLTTSMGIYGVVLVLTYYFENVLHETPMRTGLYFVPLVVALAVSATVASARLLSSVGPRPLVPVGMVLSMMGMVLFTRLSPTASYASAIMPGLVLVGLGLGLILAPAIASVTAGTTPSVVGAASGLVTTAQQIGASIGTALLNTIALTTAGRYVRTHGGSTTDVLLRGTLHGDAVAFWWAAGFFGVGAVVSFFFLETGANELGQDA
jgi:EmrB/QacA subfamily drug resistance transporter